MLPPYPHVCGFANNSEENLTFNIFHVRVALLKYDFLRAPYTESWISWAQIKAEYLRNPKMVLHAPIVPSKLEL